MTTLFLATGACNGEYHKKATITAHQTIIIKY